MLLKFIKIKQITDNQLIIRKNEINRNTPNTHILKIYL